MDNVISAGYPYEFVGLLYYVFFLLMGRKRLAGVYSRRSKLLTLFAAIVMVGCVPFHYAETNIGVTAMFVVSVVAMISTLRDAATAKKRRTKANGS
jgi:hypothetical protein